MKKTKYLEYAALRAVELSVNLAPRRLALALGASAGRLLCLLGVYRKTLLKNFGHVALWDSGEISKILPKLYRNMGRYAVDFLRRGKKLPAYRLHGYAIYESARARGQGTVIVLAHFGNWELLASIWGKQTDDLNVVARPMSNELVESWLLKKRTAQSVKTIYARNALRGMLCALRRNGITAILIDQNAGAMGTPAPFLGKTASTVRTVAGLVRKTGAAAVPVYAIMAADGSYDIHFFDGDLDVGGDDADADAVISAIQARHNDILSGWIKQYPEHWFGWFHRRFRGYLEYK